MEITYAPNAGPQLREWMNRLPQSFDEGGEVLHQGRNVVKRFEMDGRGVVVKRYKRHGLLIRLVRSLVGGNKAQRAFDNAQELNQRKVSTPEPLAVAVEMGLGGVVDCYYVCAETQLPPIAQGLDADDWDHELAKAFGRYVARLHQVGVLHNDLNKTNVLWERTGDDFRFELIDINRMEFYDHRIPDEDCMENLTLFTGREDLFLVVAETYAEARRWPWSKVHDALMVKHRHDRQWKRKKRLLHPFRKTVAMVALMALAATAGAQCVTEVRKQDKAAFDKAVEAYEAKHFVDANAQLKRLMGKNPKSADLYFYLGMVAAKQDVNPAAIKKYFTKTIELCPDYPNALAHYYMGVIHYSAERYEEAVAELNRYFELTNNAGNAAYESVYAEASNYLHWSQFLAEAELNKAPFAPQVLRGVSSKDDELLPYITWDGKECHYLRMMQQQRPKSFYNDDLSPKVARMVVSRKKGDDFGTGEVLPAPFNQNDNEGGVSITADGRWLFYSVVKTNRDGYNNCDIYFSEFRGGSWSDIVSAGRQVNGDKSWESQPSISADGQTLYFASNRSGGMGGTDIWKCHRLPNGDWSRAENLGASVNTPGNEKCPFIHADGHTLYFASDGWQGFGGYDMYFANLNDNSAVVPTNMGLPINTENDDICFGVTADGTKGYFAGKVAGAEFVGGRDVYVFDLYPAARPEPMKWVAMGVKDSEGNALETYRLRVKRFGADDALYEGDAVMLSTSEDNLVVAEAEGFLPKVVTFESQRVKRLDATKQWAALSPLKVKSAVVLDGVTAKDGKVLTEAAKKVLDEYVKYLQEHPMVHVAIQSPSLLKSQAIYDYMVGKRLRKERLAVGNNTQPSVAAMLTVTQM